MNKKPKIILLDIENSPLTIYSWQTYDANALKVLERSKIISVAWKELGSNECTVKAVCDYKGYKPGLIDDANLVKDVWLVLDEADIVIAHNGKDFDIKKLNASFVMNGLSAPSPYQVVDTLKEAKRFFKFDSNNLNALGQYLNVGKKLSTGGFDLWVDCISGDSTAWSTMKDYNMQDVLLLEKVYLKLRPFMTKHPDLTLISDIESACPTCQSTNLQKRGFNVTKTTRKQRYQCNDCYSWSSGTSERVKKT